MIGDSNPADDVCWKLYLCLREIVRVVTFPNLKRGEIQNFRELIEKHNSLYITLLGELKPKIHIWLHNPRISQLNGPVINYSTPRFKKKRNYKILL